MLRQAREDRGLAIEEVARSLNLSLARLTALERDEYDKLPAPTYVRGYLRGYAVLLGVSPERLLDAFNRLPIAAQRNDMVAPAPVKEITSSDSLVKLGTVVVVGLVVGLAALWWSGSEESPPRGAPAPPPPPASSPSNLFADLPVEPQPQPSSTDVLPPETSNEPVNAPEPAAPPVLEKIPLTTTTTTTATLAPEKITPPPVAAVPPPPANPNVALARVVLRVREDSWADVRDAEEHRLLYQTISGGRVVSVQGVPPISVFLGNVDGVQVEYNGKPYDAQRHKRGPVARFTLDDPGSR